MGSIRYRKRLPAESILRGASAFLFAVATLCFMVYTTEQHHAHADSEDLGYDIASVNTSVTVGAACTLSGTETAPHTSTISNGLSKNNIGTTILNTTCNDSGGYAIYAIGYTDNTFGNTYLTYASPDGTTANSDYDIPTGTATSGNTSSWAMQLSPVAGTTTATIENGYDSYSVVPEDYTKVASLNTVTDPTSTTSTTGSSVSTTYQAYVSPTQPAGTYSGKVKYTLVHPSTAPTPTFMQDVAKIKQLLVNEGDTVQAIDKRDGKAYWVTKLADNNIWMTQNLDFDIDSTKTYTPADTDLPLGSTWKPNMSTYTDDTWRLSSDAPDSYDPGDRYWNGTVSTSSGTISSMTNPTGDSHYHIGNYYNWTAAVAMNNSGSYTTAQQDVNQSVCPAGWRLPTYNGNKSFAGLKDAQGFTPGTTGNIHKSPVYFVYSGSWDGGSRFVAYSGYYWSSVVNDDSASYLFDFFAYNHIDPYASSARSDGKSIRCVMR